MNQLQLAGLAQPPRIYTLSFWEPWLWAMTRPPAPQRKNIENRKWAPYSWLHMRWFALHASLRFDASACERLGAVMGWPQLLPLLGLPEAAALPAVVGALRAAAKPTHGHVVAMAQLHGLSFPHEGEPLQAPAHAQVLAQLPTEISGALARPA